MKLKQVKLLVAALLISISVNAQNLVVTLTNSNTEVFALAGIQSIKFGTESMILIELDGTVNTWYINDIDNYAFNGVANVEEKTSITSEELNISPNPTSDKVTINYFTNRSGEINIDVYDINGKLIEKLFHGNHQDNTVLTWNPKQNGSVQPGKYFIKISREAKVITKPFIVQ
jgi:hypothetical protein